MKFFLKSLNPRLFNRLKWSVVVLFSLLILGASFYCLYPRTTLIFLTYSEYLDKEGNLIPELKEDSLHIIQEKLAEKGIKLIFKPQDNELKNQVSIEEYFFKNSRSYDVAQIENFKEDIPKSLNKTFKSLGIVSRYPILFLEKSNKSNIKLLKDLNNKKIIFSTSPEEGNRRFMLSEVLRLAGVNTANNNVINFWPNKLIVNSNWDILYTNYYPYDWASVNPELYQSFLQGKLRFVNFEDAGAIPINITTLELKDIPKSSYDTTHGLPNENIRIPMVTTSVVVNADLDPSLVLILAEVLKDIYSKPDLFLVKKGEFPYFSEVEYFEPHPIAKKFYSEGNQSILSKYFPPTFAAFLEKLIFIFGPIILIGYPLFLLTPKLFSLIARYKIAQWYKEIYSLEKLLNSVDIKDINSIRSQLDTLDNDLTEFKFKFVHTRYVQELYIVREHINMIKSKIDSFHH